MNERRDRVREAYHSYLRDLAGAEPERVSAPGAEPSEDADEPGAVVALRFRDLPEPGIQTVFTSGLARARQAVWTQGRPELVLSVRSADPGWASAVATLAQSMRDVCPFRVGDVIGSRAPLAGDTTMTSWLCFAPAVVPAEARRIEVGDDLPINLQGLYPIHASEADLIAAHGLGPFWDMEWDPYDVGRPPARPGAPTR